MRQVAVIGIGQTNIGELWDHSLRSLAGEALHDAMRDAGLERRPDALFVSNMMASMLSNQTHLATVIADYVGWLGIEASTVEAACASGGAAFQAAVRAIASGAIDVAAVCGVEKMTESLPNITFKALATAADADYESIHGITFVGLNALIMRRYMHEHRLSRDAFAPFAINAHRNASNNPNAMFKMKVNAETYAAAPMIADPINRLDSAPICDGAAAIILCSLDMAADLSKNMPIRVLASAAATDTIAIGDRRDLLSLDAAKASTQRAYAQARLSPNDIDVFELHDAFSIVAALSLEAAGFAEAGYGCELALNGDITLGGRIPVSTMGGLKGRGHPIGATGIYELADVVTQLRGTAGKNQVEGANIGMAQNVGGAGSTVVTHILTNN
jgi:acetyl-CoA C-acetyltransferase